MIWFVWNSNKHESGAQQICAEDCIGAAKEWARRDAAADLTNYVKQLRDGLDLRVRAGEHVETYRVRLEAARGSWKEGW